MAWDGADTKYTGLPATTILDFSPDAAYVHITSNETIEGVQFPNEPNTGEVPLVCDASSDLLHRPLPIEKYGLIFACAQKNLGPAGVTAVVRFFTRAMSRQACGHARRLPAITPRSILSTTRRRRSQST